ncbi:hypothetical protein JHL18_11205 [Clostridium sp. YIM B02505]|uniref:Uncharacterized protein n=1 Tax=Clostridium yunnanense TaxID=2800325 RepID=A0ABS1EPJ1_9CLOT|nr:hypothetical protein [Clostridium yunnanense]
MKASHIAKGGLFVALTIIFLYLSGILPTNKLALVTLASIIIPISIMATSISSSVLVYIASSILALLLVNKSIAFAYIIFFGSYGFIKYFVERINIIVIEYILKTLFFSLCFFVIYKFYNIFLLTNISNSFPLWQLILAAEAVFLIYDYALTVAISYYIKRFNKKY